MALEGIRQVLDSDYRGPRAVFTRVDVLKAILTIGDSRVVGRGRLGTMTGLGQGEVRTLIRRLKENGIIIIETDGCKLSRKGESQYHEVRSLLKWSAKVDATPLGLGSSAWAIIARGAARKIRYGIEQRDAAIKAGANGAFTATFHSSEFVVPGEGVACEREGPSEPWISVRRAPPAEGDAVIIAGSDSDTEAENGALAAFLTLI